MNEEDYVVNLQTKAIRWFRARRACCRAAINDPNYIKLLNELSESEDALYRHVMATTKEE